jgi:hypothetical protein
MIEMHYKHIWSGHNEALHSVKLICAAKNVGIKRILLKISLQK